MARGEILMKAGVVKVVKSIMLSTQNQNGCEVSRVASKTHKGSETERERQATVFLSSTRPGTGPFICKSGT